MGKILQFPEIKHVCPKCKKNMLKGNDMFTNKRVAVCPECLTMKEIRV